MHWLDVTRIAEELVDRHGDIDPVSVSFPRLKALVEAREACDALRSIEDDGATSGFAPRVREPWKATRTLAMPGCPACDAPSPLRVDDDLGWSKERCDACSAEYDRADLLAVLGELEPGA